SMSVTRGSRFRLNGLPLILSVTGTAPGPATLPAGAASAAVSRRPLPSAPVLMPTPRIKPRRENPFLGFLGASGSFLELTRHLPFASFEVGFYCEDLVVKRVNYIRNRKRHTTRGSIRKGRNATRRREISPQATCAGIVRESTGERGGGFSTRPGWSKFL